MPTPAATPLFPLFCDLRGRRVLVVGSGTIAARKVPALLEAGADVVVGAPALDATLTALAAAGRIRHLRGHFTPAWLDAAWLVIAATDDRDVNRDAAEAAHARHIFINVVDDAELASAQLPARVRRGPLQIAISSGGTAPMLARLLRERLERELDASLGTLAHLLGELRGRIRRRLPELGARRAYYRRALEGPASALLRAGQPDAARAALNHALDRINPTPAGRVTLVGAGPGDAGLLTLAGQRALSEADVILHDRLVGREVLALARADAERIDVGKRAGENHDATQRRIHALMIEHVRAGRRVVRLKGGDAFVFGRAGEELAALRAAGIPFEVVPGITAALACAAHAGIPLTLRGVAQSLHLLTAQGRDGDADHDWRALARPHQTLVFYMGVDGLPRLRERLITHGCDPATPAAVVENGGTPQQRVLVADLARIPELARQHAVRAPALLIVGEVAALATSLHWYGATPITDTARCPARPLARAA